jgi:hypothetical protein
MATPVERPPRLAFLSGAVFVILVVVAFGPLGGDTPEVKDSAHKVVTFYNDHQGRQIAAALCVLASVPFLMIFSAVLQRTLRAFEGPGGWLSMLAFAGGVVASAGFLLAVGVHFALIESADHNQALVAHAVNAIDSDNFPAFAAPIGVLVFATGFATFRGQGALPRWLGWAGIIVGLLVFTPAGFFAFGVCGIWILVASVILYLQGGSAARAPAAA